MIEIILIKQLVQNTHMSQILNQVQIKKTTNGKQVEVKIAIIIIIQSIRKILQRQIAQIVEIITNPMLIAVHETRVTLEIIHQVPITVHRVRDQNLEEVLIKKLEKKIMTISIAESGTGGLIGHRLTQVPGGSKVFSGGIITYSNESKINQLDITSKNIEDFGAVSEEVALEMAENVKNKFGTSIGISTTGIAGPGGGSEIKPVGLVYVGYCDDKLSKVKKFNFSSSRESNKIRTSQAVLNYVFKMI